MGEKASKRNESESALHRFTYKFLTILGLMKVVASMIALGSHGLSPTIS